MKINEEFNFSKLFRNKEVKKLISIYICICIFFIIIMMVITNLEKKYLSNIIMNQQAAIAEMVSEKRIDESDLVTKFYKKSTAEDIKKGKQILEKYGYNESLDINKSEVLYLYGKMMSIVNGLIIISFSIITVVIIIIFLKVLYSKLNYISLVAKGNIDGNNINLKDNYLDGEIGMLVSSINLMNERINESYELSKKEKKYLKDFILDISHQLKTPLSSLIMINDLMIDNNNLIIDRKNFLLEKSGQQLERMEWLILNLLKIGRLEVDEVNFNKINNNIIDTINLAMVSLRILLEEKKQELILSGDLQKEFLHDRDWLAEALSNIIKNSIEHTDIEGKIYINIEISKLMVEITIADNGRGMNKEKIENIFRRFYKGDYIGNHKSIGIGLSLSKAIIEKMGGKISVISKENKGTKFIIIFTK